MATASRKKVEIPDKAWLDTLKFFMGPQWLKMRFVSRQLAKLVEGNTSELPRVKIDIVKFWETSYKPSVLVASNATIDGSNEKREWFMKHGIKLDTPADLKLQDAFIGKKAQYGYQHHTSTYYCAEVYEMDDGLEFTRSKRKKIWQRLDASGYEALENREQIIFFADFNPDVNKYSWPSMEYFLNLIYNPFTYIKKAEMYALNVNLTDVLFLGEDYGSYIHCGEFILRGDLSKSLPWVQRNVRAESIYFPGNFSRSENSYKEISNIVLDTPWKCARKKIQLGIVCQWKWFVKFLIKKFRTFSAIEHVTNELPSFEFSFQEPDETLNLNFLIWDPEAVKLEPKYPLSDDVEYVVSNGRNRMEILISQRYIKKEKSCNTWITTYFCDVSIKTSTVKPAAPSREKVYISNDTWLEALKFLKFPQWTKALFVSRQTTGVAQGNIWRLPCIVIDSAAISEAYRNVVAPFVSFGDKIPANIKNQFFTDLGVSLDAPANVQHKNAVIGLRNNFWHTDDSHYCIELCLRGAAHDMQQFHEPFFFCAQFSKQKENSWGALRYFLELLYYPALYIKEVGMFALNQKMIDSVLDDEERFICCGSFTWKEETDPLDMDEFHKSLSWLERNVRANTIHFPEHIDHNNKNVYEPIARFLLDASWKCAHQEVHFKCISNLGSFVQGIVEEFRSVSFVRNDIPTITASTYGDDEVISLLGLDPDVLKLKSDDSKGVDEYLISNGSNRMQIEIFKGQKRGIHGYLDNGYNHVKYHDNWDNVNYVPNIFHVYIKVYKV